MIVNNVINAGANEMEGKYGWDGDIFWYSGIPWIVDENLRTVKAKIEKSSQEKMPVPALPKRIVVQNWRGKLTLNIKRRLIENAL